jgi:hypothetical protein
MGMSPAKWSGRMGESDRMGKSETEPCEVQRYRTGRAWRKGVPFRDRSGEAHPTLTILRPIPGSDFSWECQCRFCGGVWIIPTRRLVEYIRDLRSCGCIRTKADRDRRDAIIAQGLGL